MKLFTWLLILLTTLFLFSSCTPQDDVQTSFIEGGVWSPQLDNPSSYISGSRNIISMPNGQIWISDESSLVKYDPKSKNVTQYIVKTEKGLGIPLRLFVTSNGELWGFDFLYQGQSASDPARVHEPEWILRQYNPQTDAFEEIRDPGNILYSPTYGRREIVEDKTGSFWILVHNMDAAKHPHRAVYSKLIYYNRKTGHAEEINLEQEFKALSLDNYIGHIAIDPTGILWFSVATPFVNETEQNVYWKVVSYNPGTKEVSDFGYPIGAQYPEPPMLFFDHNGKMWTSAIAWLDFPQFGKPTWTPITRPSELVTKAYSPSGFSWEEPYYIYETSDGNYWIGSEAGLHVYNPHKNLWYRVDKFGQYRVVEDQQHQIWYAANGQIFKLVNMSQYSLPTSTTSTP